MRLRGGTGVRFTGSVGRLSARVDWGDGTRGTGTVTVRGAVVSVTVTDAATHGALTIRRAVRIA